MLRVQRTLVGRYWHDAMIQIDDFKNEGVVASGSWPYPGQPAADPRGKQIASTIPEEGATGWADTTMMHADAANPNCAYMWMEHTLSSNLQSDLAVWFGANPSVPAACTDKSGQQTEEGCKTNGSDDFDKIKFWTTPTAKCATQKRVRALLPLGLRLYRRDRRPLKAAESRCSTRLRRSSTGRAWQRLGSLLCRHSVAWG